MKNSFIADKEKRLLQIMQDAKGNSLDVYFVIYEEYLLCSENPETFLRMILEFPDKIDKLMVYQRKFPQKKNTQQSNNIKLG